MSEKLALSITETAEALGVSRGSVYSLIHADNGFPLLRVGGRTLVPAEGLRQWVEEHTETEAR